MPPDRGRMSSTLRRIATVAAARPWAVLAGWVVALAALAALVTLTGGTLRDTMVATDSSSGRALRLLQDEFPEASGATAHVVARWDDSVDEPSVEAAQRLVDAVAVAGTRVQATVVRTSDDDTTALIGAVFDDELPDVDLKAATAALTAAGQPMADTGAQVAVGGQVPEAIQGPNGVAEAIGVGVALLVLLLALGRVWAAVIPLIVATLGLAAGMCLIMLLAAATDVSTVSPTLGMMMGLGVGIDYALFIVARHREGLADGVAPREAAVRATAAAGRSVVISGTVVLVAIGGLVFAGVPGFATMGFAAGLVVLACVAAAVTTVPALLSLLGERVRPRASRRGRFGHVTFEPPVATRVARQVTAYPVRWLLAGVVVLLVLAWPAADMRLGQNDAGAERAGTPTRVAYDLVAEAFGAGANGPLVVVAPAASAEQAGVVLADDPGLADVAPPVLSADGDTATITVTPTTGPADEATFELVDRLHRSLPPGAEVAGATAAMVDTTQALGEHLWQVVLAVLLATYVLLVVLMRSLVVPLKAVLANLLSIGAAYGTMTLVFQTESGAALVGLPGPVPIPGWAPVVLFGILFGLSMDYEVFMVSRVREYYERTGDTTTSVVEGLGASAKVITVAGAIIVSVALGFALDPRVMVKIIGVGMAAAIVVDVTVVRFVVVPAALALLGRANWFLPWSRAPQPVIIKGSWRP